jgi:hypothetical protein
VICSIVLYEKVTHATILLNREDYPILMISFDNNNKGIDHESLILSGIMPLLFNSPDPKLDVVISTLQTRGQIINPTTSTSRYGIEGLLMLPTHVAYIC